MQDLRRSLYVKAKAEPFWRFWGLYVHVCRIETLREAYQMARSNRGAPGIDGVTFEAIEESGAESFLVQIRDELVTSTYPRNLLIDFHRQQIDSGRRLRWRRWSVA
jgi:RNA-directed DNA polymerase